MNLTPLVNNITLLVSLCVLQQLLLRPGRRGSRLRNLLAGALFGGAAVLGMMNPLWFQPGLIFDGRSVILSVAGLFWGPLTAAVAALVSGIYRWQMGGPGALMGVCVIAWSAGFGSACHFLRRNWTVLTAPHGLLLFGLIVHAGMLALMGTLPAGLGVQTFRELAGPILALFPAATMAVGLVFQEQEARAAMQATVRRSEEKYRTLFDGTMDAIFLVDLDTGCITDCNQAAVALIERDRSELVGLHQSALHPPWRVENGHSRTYREHAAGNRGQALEDQVLTKSGAVRDVRIRANVVEIAGKRYVQGVFHDVTDLKRAKGERDSAERRAKLVADSLPVLIAHLDRDKRYLFANRTHQDWFGFPSDKVVGKHVGELFGAAAYGLVEAHLDRCLDGQSATLALPLALEDGTRQVQVWTVPHMGEGGRVDSLHMLVEDVTERRQAEEALRKSEERYRSLVQSMAEGVILQDKSGRILTWNRKAEEIFGLGSADMVGRDAREGHLETYRPDGSPYPMQEHPPYRTLRTGRACRDEIMRVRRPDGGESWISVNTEPMFLEGDERVDAVAISFSDITAHKQAEEDLRAAKEAAEAASRAKTEFLANMSHEVRTPLNGILGMLQILESAGLSGEEQERVSMALASGWSLLAVINDILDVSCIETGRMHLHEEPFELPELVRSVLAGLSGEARRKGLEVDLQFDPDLPPGLQGDSGRLRQILFNLLGNAIKFTERGSVHIQANRDKGPEALLIEVSDTGVGIPKAQQKAIFEPFTQADGTFTRRYGGTGLGLTIVKRLAELMGGSVDLESEEGRGTTVRLRLPLRPAGPPSPSRVVPPPEPASLALRILLVEDEPVNQLYARHVLEQAGHRVSCAADGAQALELLARERFDGVLMDVQMPGMDGLEATRRIRSGEAGVLDPGVPVIAMTAHAMVGDREKFLSQGMDDYLSKPVEQGRLFEVLEEISRRRGDRPGG